MCQVNAGHINDGHQYVPVGYNHDGYLHAPHSKCTPARKDDDTKVRSRPPPCGRREAIVVSLMTLASVIPMLVAFFVYVVPVLQVLRPNLHIRLVGVDGLDPRTSPPEPLAFHLAVDADGVPQGLGYRACGGGGNSMLRVSYHGMILAWGRMQGFCTHSGGRNCVTTVVAKTEGAMVREEVRGLILSEQHVVGKAEFDVEGEVAGLGFLRCKAFLLEGKATVAEATCLVTEDD